MYSTTFELINGNFVLTVDASKWSVTQIWLEERGVQFSKYVRSSQNTVKFTFLNHVNEAINSLCKKFDTYAELDSFDIQEPVLKSDDYILILNNFDQQSLDIVSSKLNSDIDLVAGCEYRNAHYLEELQLTYSQLKPALPETAHTDFHEAMRGLGNNILTHLPEEVQQIVAKAESLGVEVRFTNYRSDVLGDYCSWNKAATIYLPTLFANIPGTIDDFIYYVARTVTHEVIHAIQFLETNAADHEKPVTSLLPLGHQTPEFIARWDDLEERACETQAYCNEQKFSLVLEALSKLG
ncbi:MAG: hypothetical protein WBF90_33720 [Rivularia sp. (in: cyanobacteria)]